MMSNMNKTIYYHGGRHYNLSALILRQPHVLIGGTTRSGKSVLLNTIICDAMCIGGRFAFIDLKGVELDMYKDTPFCFDYCDDIFKVETLVDKVIEVMEDRFKDMKAQGLRKSKETPFYLVIDEYVDIKYSSDIKPLDIEKKLMRIVSKGAAANVHVILCTQHCTNKTLTTNIKALFVSKIGLRTVNAQESRNIIGINGCENLPMFGECYVLSPDFRDIQRAEIHMYSDQEIQVKINDFIEYNKEMRKEESNNRVKRIFGLCQW